jgi:hypothetical protein
MLLREKFETEGIEYCASLTLKLQAVVLFHLYQFSAALSVLEPLYQNIEPIDEVGTLCDRDNKSKDWIDMIDLSSLLKFLQPAALHICVLMLDIAIASCQLRKACVRIHSIFIRVVVYQVVLIDFPCF